MKINFGDSMEYSELSAFVNIRIFIQFAQKQNNTIEQYNNREYRAKREDKNEKQTDNIIQLTKTLHVLKKMI